MRIVSPTAGANWGSLSGGMVNLGTDTQSYAINGWSPSFGFLGLNSASSGAPAGLWNGLAFNPNTQGDYTFRIEVRQGQFGSVLGSTDMTVSVVPAPGAIALLGVAGLTGRRRRN
jgi:MYXO-CTERM domain-containing protein